MNTLSLAGIHSRGLCDRGGVPPVDRHRTAADRSPHLCHRGQREGRAQRHPGPALCHRRFRRVGHQCGLRRLHSRRQAADRPGQRRSRLPAAGAGGAFLGSTTIKPGRVNVWGTICGVLILAVGISGIQQLGGAFFVEPLFNGTTLVISICAGRALCCRRSAVKAAPDPAGSTAKDTKRVQPPRSLHAKRMPAAPEAAAARRRAGSRLARQ